MSLPVFVFHTGSRLDADPVSFSSLEALRSWISKATGIPTQDQILLTTRGKHVKLQALLTEQEIYVFDRALFTPSQDASALIPPEVLPELYSPSKPPATLSNTTDVKAWKALFKARREWALDVLEKCKPMSAALQKVLDEQAVIEKGLRVATGNHDGHIQSLRKKHAEAKAWFEAVAKEQQENVQSWETNLSQFAAVPAKPEFVPFVLKGSSDPQKQGRTASRTVTLQDYVDQGEVQEAVHLSKDIIQAFGQRIEELGSSIEQIASDYNDLLGAVDQGQSHSTVDDVEDPLRLYSEIEAFVNKVSSDYAHVLGLPNNTKTAASVSKMALLHTRNFLPAIVRYSTEMSEVLRHSVEQKNHSVATAMDSLQAIASIESSLSRVGSEVASLEIPSEGLEAFELLALVSRLPFVYGSLLVEGVRRQEFADKMKRDSSTLTEEMASFREEEERRRKKWMKTMSDFINLDLLQGSAPSFEINVQEGPRQWPSVTRQDLQDYMKVLKSLKGQEPSLEPLLQMIRDMDTPTKRQIKYAKTFKLGSVHEAAFGKGSLLLRGEDELRVLRDANSKMEDELRAAKSRVRKLEDLLHRQSHISRLSIGSGFPPQSPLTPEPPTPDPNGNSQSARPQETASRRSSIDSRRFSANQAVEDKALTTRIAQLEAELASEKDVRASLERDIRARDAAREDLMRQLEEANATKKDLMENMEAKEKEHTNERKSLKDDLRSYEEELEKVIGSRDHERTGIDTKLQDLYAELDQTRAEAAEELNKAHADLERARKEAAEEVHRAQSQLRKLEATSRENTKVRQEQYEKLSVAHRHLSPEDTVPADHEELINSLENLALRSMSCLKDLKTAVDLVTAERDSLRSASEKCERDLRSQLENRENEVAHVREELRTQKDKVDALSHELSEERKHLEGLRQKFADGETGSEALRQRAAEEEARAVQLSLDLTEAKSHSNELDVQLYHLQRKFDGLLKSKEAESAKLRRQAEHARDLTHRLFTRTDRLFRLLESLGFAVSHQDGNMVIQRASKANASLLWDSNNPNASTSALNRSLNGSFPVRKSTEETSDLSSLQWMDSEDEAEEVAKYNEFISIINRFDHDTFSEVIAKRMRDIEHTARKWQKEARAYRDKCHKAQAEAHDKIAFKSFKEGDLALFLPTRNQATRPWAAFNVGAPHYFLREQEAHKLGGREWLVARITKVDERVVDLSKAMNSTRASDGRSIAESEGGISFEDDNPFGLSDGLRWYLLEANEEKPGAPFTPTLGKTTVASAHVDAKGSVRMKKSSGSDASKTLNKSLDSRRNSGNSRKGVPGGLLNKAGSPEGITFEAAEGQMARGAGAGPSHLRSSSGAASLRPSETTEGPGGNGDEADQGRASPLSPTRSSVVSPTGSIVPRTASASPTTNRRARSGIFDSLFQFDLSVERGKSKD